MLVRRFHGMRGDCFSRLARDVRTGLARDFTSERPQRKGRDVLRPRFSTLPRLYTANSSIDRSGNETCIFATNDAKALTALRTLRPTLFDFRGDDTFGDDGSGYG